MLIVIRSGGVNGGLRRYYRGSGMFATIARKLFSSGIKKAISSGASSAMAHKVADAVVNGATSTSKKVADAIVKEAASAAGKASARAVNTAIDSVVKKVGKKRPAAPVATAPRNLAEPCIVVPKRRKIHINSVIDGSGIVYD